VNILEKCGNNCEPALIREMERYADDPNTRGFLVRCACSKFFRPPCKGHSLDCPSREEIKAALFRGKDIARKTVMAAEGAQMMARGGIVKI
jgi:hypothetical protein